jgi:hypothetical protein
MVLLGFFLSLLGHYQTGTDVGSKPILLHESARASSAQPGLHYPHPKEAKASMSF